MQQKPTWVGPITKRLRLQHPQLRQNLDHDIKTIKFLASLLTKLQKHWSTLAAIDEDIRFFIRNKAIHQIRLSKYTIQTHVEYPLPEVYDQGIQYHRRERSTVEEAFRQSGILQQLVLTVAHEATNRQYGDLLASAFIQLQLPQL